MTEPPSVWDGRCPRHGDEMVPVKMGRSLDPTINVVYRCPVCTGLYRAKINKALMLNARWHQNAFRRNNGDFWNEAK